jgi:serine/threonine protein kinase
MLKRILLFIFLQVARTLECVFKDQFMERYKTDYPESEWTSLFRHVIGKGSFGVVYKIPFDKQRSAVLKRIPISLRSLDEFRAEAEMQKRMNDIAPNSTPEMYYCIEGDTDNYIVMDFVPYALERSYKGGQDDEANSGLRLVDFRRFHPFIRLIYYKLLIEGLADIHDNGYVHNDIKRGNIMFGTLPQPYIRYIDFGFVCGLHDDPQGGTPEYMDSVFLYKFQQSKHSENRILVNEIVEAYKQRDDNYMTDIFALALTIYRIESAPSFDSSARILVEKDEIIRERDI